MSFIGPVFVVAMIGAAIGAGMQITIAMSLLSTESIDSPSFLVRYAFRSCLFLMVLFVSLVTTPLFLVGPLTPLLEFAKESGFAGQWYTIYCLPLAILLFVADLKFIRGCDARMAAGRAALLEKSGRNQRRP